MKTTVEVWGKKYEIDVHRESKTAWIASGTYDDEYNQCKGQTSGAAVKRWRVWAEYKGG